MISTSINISINDLTKKYHQTVAIENINVEFSSGKLNILTGENGSGKSTLIKCVMKQIKYEGEILKKKYRIGYAPENYIMPDFMTGYEFLVAIGRIKHLVYEYLDIELEEYLDLFGLKQKINKPIKNLSNGMKQKINIIQALLNQPKIIILDEPLIGLDFNSQKLLIKKIIDLSKNYLVIISTHHPQKFNTKRKTIYHFKDGMLQ